MTDQLIICERNKLTTLLTEFQEFYKSEFYLEPFLEDIIQNLQINEEDDFILDISCNDEYYLTNKEYGSLELSYNISQQVLVAVAKHSLIGKVVMQTPMTIEQFTDKLTNYRLVDFEQEYSPEVAVATN